MEPNNNEEENDNLAAQNQVDSENVSQDEAEGVDNGEGGEQMEGGEGEGDENQSYEYGDEQGYEMEGDEENENGEEGVEDEEGEGEAEGEYEEGEAEGEEEEGEPNQSQSQSQAEHNEEQSQSQVGQLQLNQSNEGEVHPEDSDNEDNFDDNDEVAASLPQEREVRYKLLKFINKMRNSCHLPNYSIDLLGNKIAMQYATFLLTNKESPEELAKIAKSFNFGTNYKVSTLESFIDSDRNQVNAKYNDYSTDFYDVQATLVEFEQHSENILSEDFNKIGIGMAFNDTKVVVVDIFNHCDVIVEACSVNENTGAIVVKGIMANEQYGAYALRIVKADTPNKTLLQITPQHITPGFSEGKVRAFTATFVNASSILSEPEQKIIEVYIRVKPELIPYNKAFTDKIRFEDLLLGARIPLENFPIDRMLREEHRQDMEDEKQEKKNQALLAEYEKNKMEEKKRRMQNDAYAYGKEGVDEMGEIPEEPDEGDNLSDRDEPAQRGSESGGGNKSKLSDSIEFEMSKEKNDNYEKELNELEGTIEKLKEDNEKIQKKIKVIYEFRKKEGREERNFYKESNINESTYADSLSSTAALYNDLNTHKTKLDQDLKRYQQSIDEQERKKQEVYDILMEYKTELLENAETRKGTKIPRAQIEEWLNKERRLEEDIKDLRIQSFTKTLEMNRLKKELKKMEDYFEGLHIIDFEQLKIENNTLTEKIEDRNEEIHKLKNKINYTVQILAHLQEKSKDISIEKELKKNENDELKKKIIDMKMKLTSKKEENDKKALKQLNENKKIDQINSVPLKNYYKKTLDHIATLSSQIETVSKQLMIYRQNRKANTKDIKELLHRKERMMKDYKTLPKIEDK